MEASSLCPYRFVHKGRTFCAIAIRERRYTTAEVVPTACSNCRARVILEEVRCRHLDLGVEVDQYGGSHDVNVFYASCEKLVERLMSFKGCGEGNCEHWQPTDFEHLEGIVSEARDALRDREANFED